MRLGLPPSLRPAGADDLGLRQALAGRILPFLVAAMAFLAALSVGGVTGAAALARHWRLGAAAVLTIQVPNPGTGAPQTRMDQVLSLLRATPEIAAARALSDDELAELLRPWLGRDAERIALPLPGVIDLRLVDGAAVPHNLAARLRAAVPGTELEDHGPWLHRLSALAASLRAGAILVLTVVAVVAAAVIAVATRAGLIARRDAIEIVHGLGATDGLIAGRFAGRTTRLAVFGALLGAILAVPVLARLAQLVSPLTTTGDALEASFFAALPPGLWLLLPGLPAAAGMIGWITTQVTVRLWLRRLA